MQPKYESEAKLCHMDPDNCVYEIKTIFLWSHWDIETRFDASGYSKNENRSLLIGKNKVLGIMKTEPDEKLVTEFVALSEKSA